MQRDEWAEKYKPQEFSFGSESGLHENLEENGVVFTRIGKKQPEFGEVVKADPNKVWTELEVDGLSYIVSGFHVVNSVGYFITEEPFDPNETVQVTVWGEEDEAELQQDNAFHFIDALDEEISPTLKNNLLEGFRKEKFDDAHLSGKEPDSKSYPGLNEDQLEELSYSIETLVGLGALREDQAEGLNKLLRAGSFPFPPALKPASKGPSM
ncbi:hypothetical protein CL689_02650 [Candidatus Saccharibacteria bacterium]|nr:hypothetical protein [Candidatus Saccharibacteria bacterium]|tara:strand:- start:8236 stop:8865 length:630 start_codon:yes stop_codon:yes gene_type:complete